MRIGCQRYKHGEWENFKRPEISSMADRAWDWWKDHKEMLFSACSLQVKMAAAAAKEKSKAETV
jgi:hypothetical protein